jgi:hypothetical protein
MRHPVERLISQYVHEWTQRVIDEPIDEAVERHPFLIDYSRYAMQLRPYLEAFGARRVLPVFLERLRAAPQAELERIARFIGYGGRPRWDPDLHDNASAERLRASPMRDRLINLPGLREIRRGLIPKAVRNRVKQFWTMNEPPRLSDAARRRLEEVFDRDLATLGAWLGVRLSCANFKQVTAERPLSWSVEADRIPA